MIVKYANMDHGNPETVTKKISLDNCLLTESHWGAISYSKTLDGVTIVRICRENISPLACGECKLKNACISSQAKER